MQMLKETRRTMRKHQAHRFDNSQTGGFVVNVSIFMHLKRAFQISMKKCLPNSGPILGVCLILECDLYSNKYSILRESELCIPPPWYLRGYPREATCHLTTHVTSFFEGRNTSEAGLADRWIGLNMKLVSIQKL